MKSAKISNMTKGWFVGAFEPTIYNTECCEVAVKKFNSGDCEDKHYHKIATEITVIISGRVRMFSREWVEGDIVIAEPLDETSFEALTDAVLTVVKLPGALNDKYVIK